MPLKALKVVNLSAEVLDSLRNGGFTVKLFRSNLSYHITFQDSREGMKIVKGLTKKLT